MSTSNAVSLNIPTKYGGKPSAGPSLSWLCRTWTITHSTLKSWATSKNARITYTATSPGSNGCLKVRHTTKCEPLYGKGAIKSTSGTSTAVSKGDAVSGWEAKGKGLLKASTRWEILGWGDIKDYTGAVVESWMIVWYPSGVEIMSNRKQGLGSETSEHCVTALKTLPKAAAKLRNQVVMDLRVVEIGLPWKE